MMFAGKKLSQEMSYGDLMGMRETGMSNQEIANSVGCSVATVIRMIGKQPHEITRRVQSEAALRRWNGEQQTETKVEQKPEKPEQQITAKQDDEPESDAIMLVDERMYRVCGMCATYEVSDKSKTVKVTVGSCEISVKFDEISTFIQELKIVRKKIDGMNESGIESWS